MNQRPQLERLISVVEKLRDPQSGCPWDLEQTHESLLRYLIEEAYEYIEAVEKKNKEMMREELGDVLLQVILHSVIAHQAGQFTLEDVAQEISNKLIHRHPHVFGDGNKNLSAQEVREQWEAIKYQEKKKTQSAIPYKLIHNPALKSSELIGKASTKVNFDWENYQQVVLKVEEEWQEVKEELPPTGVYNTQRVEEELGDLLFSVAQLCRHLNLDPEETLRKANKKFLKRFASLEQMALKEKSSLLEFSANELEHFWNKAKGEAP
jgi:MazG family protein